MNTNSIKDKRNVVVGRIALVLLLIITVLCTSVFFAHGGRTDAYGGHKDNKNKSGLGYYHYHCGGHPPHLHKNNECPYAPKSTAKVSNSSKLTSGKTLEIKAAQQKLNDLGYNCGTPDGSIGKKTTAAIKAFQKDWGLTVDGKLGPKTLAALGKK